MSAKPDGSSQERSGVDNERDNWRRWYYDGRRQYEHELAEREAEISRLEQLVCDFQAASMLDANGQGGPCEIEPHHTEKHVLELRSEVESLREQLHSAHEFSNNKAQAYREALDVPPSEVLDGPNRIKALRAEMVKARALLGDLADAIIWMSGSPEFGNGGPAQAHWRSVVSPKLKEAQAFIAQQNGSAS